MSRNKDKITKALNAKGYTPTDIAWTQPFGSPIMCGPEGGWYVDFKPIEGMRPSARISINNIGGYSVSEVMEEIEKLPPCIPK